MNTKRQVMKDLERKAIEARDKEVERARKEILSSPKIPGLNRAAIRRLTKQLKSRNRKSVRNEKTAS